MNNDHEKLIHVLNVIGYAFDDVSQPDYKYFFKSKKFTAVERQKELVKRYEAIFRKIYACARDRGLTTIVMSLFGAQNFAGFYPGGPEAFQRKVWVPAFKNSKEDGFNLKLMGSEYSTVADLLPDIKDIGWFPDNVAKVNKKKTLFVNAWDPLSLPGNGNEKDDSLDGVIGRVTNIAVTGSGLTNPYLQYVTVDEK